jgi:hypothetical protein
MQLKNSEWVVRCAGRIFEHIKHDTGEFPKTLQPDNGSEFVDKNFRAACAKREIRQIFSLPHTPQSQGQVERTNLILKRMLSLYRQAHGETGVSGLHPGGDDDEDVDMEGGAMELRKRPEKPIAHRPSKTPAKKPKATPADDYSNPLESNPWYPLIQQIVTNYNEKPQGVTKHAPVDLLKAAKSKDIAVLESASKNLEKNALTGKVDRIGAKLHKVGEIVRIKLGAQHRGQAKSATWQWSYRPYIIKEVGVGKYGPGYRKTYYYVAPLEDDLKTEGKPLKERLYNSQIMAFVRPDTAELGEETVIIDRLVREEKRNGKIMILTKWLDGSEPTWEPREHLMKYVPHLVEDFERKDRF